MNIFVVDDDATLSAHQLPDKHIVKMPLECCQMLSIVYSSWYHNIGKVFKADGTPYKNGEGCLPQSPIRKWVAESDHNIQWLIQHGISLCEEYTYRYNKKTLCERSIRLAGYLYQCGDVLTNIHHSLGQCLMSGNTTHPLLRLRHTSVMLLVKPWVKDNYLRVPDRKPSWLDYYSAQCVCIHMYTQQRNTHDFCSTPRDH